MTVMISRDMKLIPIEYVIKADAPQVNNQLLFSSLQALQISLEKIENKDLGKFEEGWTTEGLATSYKHVLNLFKAKYKVNIFIKIK